jgi:hypothetical protein
METFIQQHADKIIGQISGWDRLRFRGTLRMLAHVLGLQRWLCAAGHLLKDFGAYALALSERTRTASLQVAEAAGRPVQYLPDPGVSKEDVAREIQVRDGITEGLICTLTAVEPCGSFRVRGNRATQHLELVSAWRKCLHVYHYYQHPEFGFMHVRLQTWLPFNQFICLNGREWLARQMDKAGIKYRRRDNCFAWISDVEGAQDLLQQQVTFHWDRVLTELALQAHPAWPALAGVWPMRYYWSLEASEWATDIMFQDPRELARLYPRLVRHAMESFHSRDVMRFLGHKVPLEGPAHGNFAGEVVSDLKERSEGLRIKHRVNANSLKMYDKQGSVLRTETTLNDMRDLKSPRIKDGKVTWQRMRKGVGDMARRAEVSQGCNERYLEALAALETPLPLKALTEDLARPVTRDGRRARGLNLLGADDARLLELVADGKYLLNGFRNKDLREVWFKSPADSLAEKRRQSGQITRKITLLRLHGVIRKVPGTHRYLVTTKGRRLIGALLAARTADIAKLARAA